MSVSRFCEFWKADNGKWYMDLAPDEHGEYESANTYGPFSSEEAADKYLRDNFSNPGSDSVDDSGTRPAPTKSPNGGPIIRPGGSPFKRSSGSLQHSRPGGSPVPRGLTGSDVARRQNVVKDIVKGGPFPWEDEKLVTPLAKELLKSALVASAEDEPKGALLPVRKVRARAGMSKKQFDAAALALANDGIVTLHHHDHARALSDVDRIELVDDGRGNYYVGIALRTNQTAQVVDKMKAGGSARKVYSGGKGKPPVTRLKGKLYRAPADTKTKPGQSYSMKPQGNKLTVSTTHGDQSWEPESQKKQEALLRRFVRLSEAPNRIVELPRDELEALLDEKSPDDVADADYVDAETGEIVWEAGEALKDTNHYREMHPELRAADDQYADLGADDFGADDEEDARDDVNYHDRLSALIDEYADTWRGLAPDLGDVKPEDAAPDAAESFFILKPEWRDLAQRAGMSKNAVREMVVDAVYNAIVGAANESVSITVGQLRSLIVEAARKSRTKPTAPSGVSSTRERLPPIKLGWGGTSGGGKSRTQEIADNAHDFANKYIAKYGVPEYVDDVAQTAVGLAGYTGADADLYRDRLIGHFMNVASGTPGV